MLLPINTLRIATLQIRPAALISNSAARPSRSPSKMLSGSGTALPVSALSERSQSLLARVSLFPKLEIRAYIAILGMHIWDLESTNDSLYRPSHHDPRRLLPPRSVRCFRPGQPECSPCSGGQLRYQLGGHWERA